jgi:pimeloyl-ACP methyl ester carboxylesterase
MGLTSSIFLLVVAAAAVVTPVLTVLLWSRVHGPGGVRIAQRFGLIAICQGTAVLLCALLVNNTFQLYDSWSDLFGDDGSPGQIIDAQPQTGATFNASLGTEGHTLANAKLFHPYAAYNGVYAATVTGPASKITGTVLVWLPPQYNEKQYAHTDFPVVELLPGTPGTAASWLFGMQAPQVLEQQMQHGASRPFILVSAPINVDGAHNPDCSDIPNGPKVATWLASDVRALVETSFRASTARTGWGVMGFSEGGYCASKLLLQYPNDYAAAVSMSGDDHPDGDLLTPGTPAYNQNSPLWLLSHGFDNPVSLLLTGTLQDGETAQEAQAMSRAASWPTVVDVLIAARGGHNTGVWKAVEPQAFAWLSTHLTSTTAPKAAPARSVHAAAPPVAVGIAG